MHRIDTTNAVADLFGVGKPGFGPGNPSTNTPATYLDEDWCNAIQEELATVVEANAALNKSNRGQLLAALQALFLRTSNFTGANQSLSSASGFQKLPGGLIVQWGSGVGSNGAVVTLPTAYPNANRMVVGSDVAGFQVFGCTSRNLTQFTIQTPATTISYSYISIGY